jgi:hypothetical protein
MKSTQHPRKDEDEASPAGDKPKRTSGPRDENSVVISLSALLAMEEDAAAHDTPSAGDDDGLIDFAAPWTQEEQRYTGYVGVFPFGTPTDSSVFKAPVESMPFDVPVASMPFDASAEPPPFGRPPELTPLPFEMSLVPLPTGRRPKAGLVGALGLLAAAAVATGVWLGAPREALRAPAQAGLSQVARTVATRLPRLVQAPAPATAEHETPVKGSKDRKKGTKKRSGTSGGAAARPARPAAVEREQPAPVAATAPNADPCNGDLACAMHRATGN